MEVLMLNMNLKTLKQFITGYFLVDDLFFQQLYTDFPTPGNLYIRNERRRTEENGIEFHCTVKLCEHQKTLHKNNGVLRFWCHIVFPHSTRNYHFLLKCCWKNK